MSQVTRNAKRMTAEASAIKAGWWDHPGLLELCVSHCWPQLHGLVCFGVSGLRWSGFSLVFSCFSLLGRDCIPYAIYILEICNLVFYKVLAAEFSVHLRQNFGHELLSYAETVNIMTILGDDWIHFVF